MHSYYSHRPLPALKHLLLARKPTQAVTFFFLASRCGVWAHSISAWDICYLSASRRLMQCGSLWEWNKGTGMALVLLHAQDGFQTIPPSSRYQWRSSYERYIATRKDPSITPYYSRCKENPMAANQTLLYYFGSVPPPGGKGGKEGGGITRMYHANFPAGSTNYRGRDLCICS